MAFGKEVTKLDRERAVSIISGGDVSKCGEAFIAEEPALCSCNGKSHTWSDFRRAAATIASARVEDMASGRREERDDAVAWIRSLDKTMPYESLANAIDFGEHVTASRREHVIRRV